MKLTTEQAQHVADQLDGQAIPEEHPNAPQLREAMGDHTFFLNNEGLHIVEPDTPGTSAGDAAALRIASWSSEEEGQLLLHEPQPAKTVKLEPAGSDGSQ